MVHIGRPYVRLRARLCHRVPRRILIMRAVLCGAIVLPLLFSTSQRPIAATPLPLLNADRRHQKQAIDSIPVGRLTQEAQRKISDVVNRPSIYRQMPVTVVRSDPELYLFMIRHPEVVVNMWDLMGVTKVTMARTGQYTFDAQDGAGTECSVELLYGDRNVHVMYSEGHYEGPLLRKLIRGRCILILNSEFAKTQDGSVYVTNRLDMFVRFDNIGAEFLARTLHPLVGRSADHNFVESTKFLGQVSDAAATKLERLHRFSRRLTKIDADTRLQFDTIAAGVTARMVAREQQQDGNAPTGVASRNARGTTEDGLFQQSRPAGAY
jgi:hypothetical protein